MQRCQRREDKVAHPIDTLRDAAVGIGTSIPGQEGLILAGTGDKETGIAKIFDAERVKRDVMAQTQITQTFTMLAPAQAALHTQA